MHIPSWVPWRLGQYVSPPRSYWLCVPLEQHTCPIRGTDVHIVRENSRVDNHSPSRYHVWRKWSSWRQNISSQSDRTSSRTLEMSSWTELSVNVTPTTWFGCLRFRQRGNFSNLIYWASDKGFDDSKRTYRLSTCDTFPLPRATRYFCTSTQRWRDQRPPWLKWQRSCDNARCTQVNATAQNAF